MLEKLIIYKDYDCDRSFILSSEKDISLLYKISETRMSYPILEEHKFIELDIHILNVLHDEMTEEINFLYEELIWSYDFKHDYPELYVRVKERHNEIMEG